MLEKERGINRTQYTEDILWPSLALRKLAAPELTVRPKRSTKPTKSQFGPAAKVRLIVLSSKEKAEKLRAKAAGNPDDFPALARQHSEDAGQRQLGRADPPIRHHLGDRSWRRCLRDEDRHRFAGSWRCRSNS